MNRSSKKESPRLVAASREREKFFNGNTHSVAEARHLMHLNLVHHFFEGLLTLRGSETLELLDFVEPSKLMFPPAEAIHCAIRSVAAKHPTSRVEPLQVNKELLQAGQLENFNVAQAWLRIAAPGLGFPIAGIDQVLEIAEQINEAYFRAVVNECFGIDESSAFTRPLDELGQTIKCLTDRCRDAYPKPFARHRDELGAA